MSSPSNTSSKTGRTNSGTNRTIPVNRLFLHDWFLFTAISHVTKTLKVTLKSESQSHDTSVAEEAQILKQICHPKGLSFIPGDAKSKLSDSVHSSSINWTIRPGKEIANFNRLLTKLRQDIACGIVQTADIKDFGLLILTVRNDHNGIEIELFKKKVFYPSASTSTLSTVGATPSKVIDQAAKIAANAISVNNSAEGNDIVTLNTTDDAINPSNRVLKSVHPPNELVVTTSGFGEALNGTIYRFASTNIAHVPEVPPYVKACICADFNGKGKFVEVLDNPQARWVKDRYSLNLSRENSVGDLLFKQFAMARIMVNVNTMWVIVGTIEGFGDTVYHRELSVNNNSLRYLVWHEPIAVNATRPSTLVTPTVYHTSQGAKPSSINAQSLVYCPVSRATANHGYNSGNAPAPIFGTPVSNSDVVTPTLTYESSQPASTESEGSLVNAAAAADAAAEAAAHAEATMPEAAADAPADAEAIAGDAIVMDGGETGTVSPTSGAKRSHFDAFSSPDVTLDNEQAELNVTEIPAVGAHELTTPCPPIAENNVLSLRHQCPECAKSYKYPSMLNNHREIHMPKTCSCEEPGCQESFSGPIGLNNHMRKYHRPPTAGETAIVSARVESSAIPSASTPMNAQPSNASSQAHLAAPDAAARTNPPWTSAERTNISLSNKLRAKFSSPTQKRT